MTSNLKACICLAAIGLTLNGAVLAQTPSFINDSTTARYRYEVEEYTIAQVSSGTAIEDINIFERDFLKPIYRHSVVTEGVNEGYQHYFQIQNLESTQIEDWMSTPDYALITPTGSYGFHSNGEQVYYFPAPPVEVERAGELTDEFYSNGYRPIMLFFPNIYDEFVAEAEMEGAILYELDENAFKLEWVDREIIFEPETKTITKTLYREGETMTTATEYVLYAPYGYVIKFEHKERTRTDIPNPVTLVTRRSCSNHVIEDQYGAIPKYTEEAYIEVYPVPVESEYTIVLNGIPDAQVSQVQVRDYQGNIVFTHVEPVVSQDMIELSGAEYTSGMLIILVYTQNEVYTETITKS